MNNLPSLEPEHLESAFVSFNQLSEKLSVSHSELEKRDAILSDELTESGKLRFVQIAETGTLANSLKVILDTLLERMVTDMLIFARGDAVGDENIEVREFLLELKSQLAQDDRIDVFNFIIDGSLGKASLRINKDILHSVLQNLVDNAIDASISETRVIVRATLIDQHLRMQIKDYGSGMSEEVKDRILEPFYTTRNDGTGLGLSIVDQVINHIGGVMRIHSQQAVGTTVCIEIPLSTSDQIMTSRLNASRNDDQAGSVDTTNVTKPCNMKQKGTATLVTGQEVSQ